MPGGQSRRPSDVIVQLLLEKDPSLDPADLRTLSRHQLVRRGFENGVLDEKEFWASIPTDTYVVKSYLWSYLDDETHRDRIRDYVVLCTKVQHRAYLTLKTAYFACSTGRLGPEYSVKAFVEALLKNSAKGFEYLVFPLHLRDVSHPLKPFVDATRREFFSEESFDREGRPRDQLQDDLVGLITRTGLDNAKKYIATKVRTAVFNHVFVHLHRRVKGSLHARKNPEEESDISGMCELYDKGETSKSVGPRDRETVIALRQVFLTDEQAKETVDIPDPSPTPNVAEMLLHLECCRLAEDTRGAFTPFPNASFTRCYQRLCTRIFCLLLKVQDMHVTINLKPNLARKRAKRMRNAKAAVKAETAKTAWKKRNGHFSMRRNHKDALVSSIETDGVGLSIVLEVERPERVHAVAEETRTLTAKERKEYAERKRKEEIAALRPLLQKENAVCRGLDPGRVNLYTTAERGDVRNEDGVEIVTYEKMFYSRKRHLENCGRDRMQQWRDARAQRPLVSTALKALATTGGAKTHVASRWFAYLEERSRHLEVLEEEFMYNDERCKQRMAQFRMSQRFLTRAADRLLLEGNEPDQNGRRRPVIIGYGNGRGNGGGHKGEQGVPVKAMYRALMEAFKRHRISGGVVNIWEHLTTAKCHRCHETMRERNMNWTEEDVEKEKRRLMERWEITRREARERNEVEPPLELPSDEELFGRQKKDRNFRICERCSSSDQPWKLRNRDFNAAINILTLLETELRGEERPPYLCTQRQRGAGTSKRRRREAPS